MRLRIRSAWLEIAAGFISIFCAMSARAVSGGLETPSAPPSLVESALLLAACAMFVLHGLRSSRRARRACFAFSSVMSMASSLWLAYAGRTDAAVMQGILGLYSFGAAAFYYDADQPPASSGGKALNAFYIYVGAVCAAIAVTRFLIGTPAAAATGAGLIAVALALAWAEWRGERRARMLAVSAAALAAMMLSYASFSGGLQGTGGAYLSIFAILVISIAAAKGLPESSDDLAGTTGRQREIYAYQRAGEIGLWSVMAFSVGYAGFLDHFDFTSYFGAFLCAASVSLVFFRLKPAKSLSDRSYLSALLGIVTCTVLLIVSAGGTAGPFMYFSYLAVFSSTLIVAPAWALATSGIYVGYVLVEAAYRFERFGFDPSLGLSGKYGVDAVFLSLTLIMTGIYAIWFGRRRVAAETSLSAANRRLAEALKTAVRDRELSDQRSEEQRRTNDDLVEMRSAIMNVLEDVEESKRQLENDRHRESASLNALGEGVVATEKDGKIFLCNPAAAALLGLEAEKVIGQQIDRVVRLFHEDGEVLDTEAFEKAFSGSAAQFAKRLMLMRDDGRRLPVSGTVAPYFNETNALAGIVLAFRDVTVEREIDRQKSDFISIASHQLRTPLSAVRWFLDLLITGDAGELNATQKEYLSDVYSSTTRMIKLVGDLLDVSRIEAGNLKPKPEKVEIPPFVDALVREQMPLAKSQDVAFTTEIAPGAAVFYADPSMIHQAISNVLANAMKYTPAGGTVSLIARLDGGKVKFTVKDSGVGIPRSQQYRVFDKFFRGENVITKETVGSGLGLYVTKQIVESAGGQVSFESSEGKGSVFTVALPAKPSAGTISA